MTQTIVETTQSESVGNLEQEIRSRIESLSYLPTSAAVAMKFVELGKKLDADPSDYAKVISADSSLSSKMLALANSSWAGVRNKVANVRTAVNLLGLGTVRTLAISYCITGLHDELKLSAEESEWFWEASLCKAVAAKKYAMLTEPTLGDEAFVVGLFQDFAIPVMYATAREEYQKILQAPQSHGQEQLQSERQLFRMDHAEVGRMLAEKLELPELFVDAIAFHHKHEKLTEFVERKVIADAIHVASLFPHLVSSWSQPDAEAMESAIRDLAPSTDPHAYLAQVQEEFDQVYSFFHDGESSETNLADLLERATREAADNTTELVGKINELMQHAAGQGMQTSELGKNSDATQDSAKRDLLTDVHNQESFTDEATALMLKANRYGTGFGMLYFGIDGFTAISEDLGKERADLVIKAVAVGAAEKLSEKHLLGRIGEHEFAALLHDCTDQEAARLAQNLVSGIAAQTVRLGDQSTHVTVSAGMLFIRPTERALKLEAILGNAAKLMNKAREAGGNRVDARSVKV